MEPKRKDGNVSGTLYNAQKLSFNYSKPGDSYGILAIAFPAHKLLQDGTPFRGKYVYPL